jgi:hypothetical protein
VAEVSFPSAGGGSVTDVNYEALMSGVLPSGLIGNASGYLPMVYADATGRQVKCRPNREAIVRGFHWETDAAGITRAVDANTSGNTRIDLAVLRLNRADWTVTFQVVKGTPAAAPVAPNPTQQTGPTGVWELPLAHITVANNASGLASNTVAEYGLYISPGTYTGALRRFPAAAVNAATYYAADVGRFYANLNDGGFQIIGEAGGFSKLDQAQYWNGGTAYARRWNGFVYLQMILSRSGNDLPANSETILLTLPAGYRPQHDTPFIGYSYSAGAVEGIIDKDSGTVRLISYAGVIKNGTRLGCHPVVYEAVNN